MPYSCTRPYNRNTAATFDRVNSCSRSNIGPYKNKQPCVQECYEDGPGRAKTLNAAAARLQKSFKSKKFKTSLLKRLAEARAKKSAKPKQKTRKKTGCPANSRSDCISPCKWASGSKHSYCRTKYNRKKNDEGVYINRPRKSKTGCPANSRSDCISPCKWASGSKRSFCRKGKNSKK
jgi:hypothetical protein